MDAMQGAGLNYIDWLKIDTQGTDLRIFKSLPDDVQRSVLVAEFEPGIIDAYKGEDKLFEIMRHMREGFFMSSLEVKGVPRLKSSLVTGSGLQQRAKRGAHKVAPGWAEVAFMNLLGNSSDSRGYQLQFVFALLEKQFGFAAEVAERGKNSTGEELFDELGRYAQKKLSKASYQWPLVGMRNRFVRAFNAVFD